MKEFRKAKLYDAGGDLTKRWFVYYHYMNPDTGKMKRFRVYDNINTHLTVRNRREEARITLLAMNEALAEGYNPFRPGDYHCEPVEGEEPTKTLDGAIAVMLKIKSENNRPKTVDSYKLAFRRLANWAKAEGYLKKPVRHFSRNVAIRFIDSLMVTMKAKSRNNILTLMRAAFNAVIDREIAGFENLQNPFRKIPMLKVDAGRNIAFTPTQQRDLRERLQAENPRLLLFCQFVYYCFVRPKELVQLRVRDIDLENKLLYIPGHISKNRKSAAVAIPGPFVEELKALGLDNIPGDWFIFAGRLMPGYGRKKCHRFPNGAGLYPHRVAEIHREVLDKMGFTQDHTLYSWKHTGVVRAFKGGVDIMDLMNQLRHSSLDMVRIYLKSLGLTASEDLRNRFPAF